MEISKVRVAEIPEPKGGKYEPVRQGVLALKEGEALRVVVDTDKDARKMQASLLGAARRLSNSLYGVPFTVACRGNAVFIYRSQEEEP